MPALNPPFLQCSPADTDVAIYKIQAKADLRKLLQNTGGTQVPVIFEMLVDTLLTDQSNLIINNNNYQIIGKLIAFTGEQTKKKIVNAQLQKITTSCKNTSIIDKLKFQKGKGPKQSPAPAVIPSHSINQLNPPFIKCAEASAQLNGVPSIRHTHEHY